MTRTVGGTSLSAPLWSALIAIANEGRAFQGRGTLGNAQTVIYNLGGSRSLNLPRANARGLRLARSQRRRSAILPALAGGYALNKHRPGLLAALPASFRHLPAQ